MESETTQTLGHHCEQLRTRNTLAGVILGAVLGYVSARLRDWHERKRTQRGHLEALKAEILICSAIAEWYLRERYMAPAYRVPLIAYEKSLPALLAEGLLSEKDTSAIIHFYVTGRSLNLCLDLAQEARGDDVEPPFRLETCTIACSPAGPINFIPGLLPGFNEPVSRPSRLEHRCRGDVASNPRNGTDGGSRSDRHIGGFRKARSRSW
jgi:hypothetical protein